MFERRAFLEEIVSLRALDPLVGSGEKQAPGGERGFEDLVPVRAFQRDRAAPVTVFAVALVESRADEQILVGHVFGGPRGIGGGGGGFDGESGLSCGCRSAWRIGAASPDRDRPEGAGSMQ